VNGTTGSLRAGYAAGIGRHAAGNRIATTNISDHPGGLAFGGEIAESILGFSGIFGSRTREGQDDVGQGPGVHGADIGRIQPPGFVRQASRFRITAQLPEQRPHLQAIIDQDRNPFGGTIRAAIFAGFVSGLGRHGRLLTPANPRRQEQGQQTSRPAAKSTHVFPP
jgi:hypothetical protein